MTNVVARPAAEHPLLVAVRALTPQIAVAGEAGDRDRRLPQPLIDAMAAAGLFRMYVPRSMGGGEADLATCLGVLETVAMADGSTAWCLGQGAISAAQVAPYLEPSVAREIFGDPKTIMSNGPGPAGQAVVTDGGYRLTGAWGFASGSTHATWLKGQALIYREDGSPVLRDNGRPADRTLLFPAQQAEIKDTWHVSGLRGTGSNTIVVRDLLVPAARTLSIPDETLHEDGPLYRIPYVMLACTGFCAVALGIARGALDAFLELAQEKTPRGARTALRDNPVTQAHVARCEAQLRSARAFLFETVDEAWRTVLRGDRLSVPQRALLRLAATSGSQQAAQVVDAVYSAAGATAIFESQPFERRFRDVHAVTQQVQANPMHFEAVGRVFLGLDPDSGYL